MQHIALSEDQERAIERLVAGEQVADDNVPLALVDVGAGGRVPAEVVVGGAAG